VPYKPDPPARMPGKEALAHIRQTDQCSTSDAIRQLKAAISDRKIGALLRDPKSPGRSAIFPPGADQSIFAGIGIRQIPSPKQWQTAKIRANGTVRFFGEGSPWYAFEVLRENVLRLWPDLQPLPIKLNRKKAPITYAIQEAIKHLWPEGIPQGIKAKERNNRIYIWAKENGYSPPAQAAALSKAVQRVLKSRS
jgi:hypothetical protein